MKFDFKKILYPTLSLVCICLVASLLLAVTNDLTKGPIEESRKNAEIKQRSEIFASASSFEEKDGYVCCLDENGNVVGYIFTTEGKGYGGAISVMTGIGTDGKITGVSVLSHSETASVGGKAINNGLADGFAGKNAETFVNGKNVDGVSGATRTTNGVIAAVNEAVEKYNEVKGGDAK